MLVKRDETGDLIRSIYKSSTILASAYNTTSKDLTVTFNNGGTYTYEGVTLGDFTYFEMDESQGRVLNSHIKKYPFIKGDKVDTQSLLNEITESEANELKSFEALLVMVMDDLTADYKANGEINLLNLKEVERVIKTYKTKKGIDE